MGWMHLGVILLGLYCTALFVGGLQLVNVAPGKTYNQSRSNSSTRYPPSYAVNNRGYCFWSGSNNSQEWWEVDLGKTYPVSLILIYTSDGSYLYPFTITVDDKPCLQVTNDSRTDLYLACSCVIYGRLVRITRTTSGQLRLCNVQINVPSGFVICEAGQWGSSCLYNCSNKCGGGPGTNFCHQHTGVCYEENVAVGKTYRQWSTYSTYLSSFAANGNTGDYYRSDNTSSNQWWEVDLGRKYLVYDIQINTYSVSYLYPFKITVDNQLCVNETLDQQRSNPTITCSSVMYGQVVRISRTMQGPLDLIEVEIMVPSGVSRCPAGRYGDECELDCSFTCGEGPGASFCYQNTGECYQVNVAKGKTYNQSSTYGLYQAKYAADKDTDTCFRSHYNQRNQEWWEVDLGRKYPVHLFQISTYSSSYSSNLYPFTITVDGQMCVNETSFNSATFPTVACSVVMYGQVVRITRVARGQLRLCEFEIKVPSGVSRCEAGRWGPQCNHHCSNTCGGGPGYNFCYQGTGDCYDVNVATGKTYSGSSRYSSSYPSTYAADSVTDTCFWSQNASTHEWWEVNLGRKYPVYQFQASTHLSDYDRYLYPFTVTVDGEMCVNETSFPTVACSAVMYGQVVRITRVARGQLRLCEFEIKVPSGVSRCEAGRWGPQCKHHCSNTCGGGPGYNFCYQGTGDCYDGCLEGWWGNRCQHRCNKDCKQHACQQDNGSCAGCRDGYHGDTCFESCSNITDQCQQCTQGGSCTTCGGNFQLPACTICSDGFYLKKPDAVHCTECPWRCDNDKPCNKTTGDCNKCPSGWEGQKCLQRSVGEAEKLVGPVVGSVTSVGLLLAVVVLAAICWCRRSQMKAEMAETRITMSSIAEPMSAPTNVYTSPLTIANSTSVAAQEDLHQGIRDPPNVYERLYVHNNMALNGETQSSVNVQAAGVSDSETIYVNTHGPAPGRNRP